MTDQEILIAAGARAFGDGSHPTTQGVLAALEAIDAEAFSPRAACDMGAGSGILSLAIAVKFRCPVMAVDMEAQAVETLQQNSDVHEMSHLITALHAKGFDHPKVQAAAPYDLIVMNILAEPLLALARDAESALAPEAVLIISGLLQWQEAQIREAYSGLGLELASRLVLGDWVTLCWQKP